MILRQAPFPTNGRTGVWRLSHKMNHLKEQAHGELITVGLRGHPTIQDFKNVRIGSAREPILSVYS